MRSWHSAAASVALAAIALTPVSALSQPALSAATLPPPNRVRMPLIDARDGERYMVQRQVPESSLKVVPGLQVAAPVAAAQANMTPPSPSRAVASPVLGHVLPTGAMSPLGTSRASFAIAPVADQAPKAQGLSNARIHRDTITSCRESPCSIRFIVHGSTSAPGLARWP